jgi:hypothetical protein
LLELLRGPDHATSRSLPVLVTQAIQNRGTTEVHFVAAIRGFAAGLLDDLEAGFLPDLTTRIRSEVEGDLLGQVQRLLDDGMKDAAAMLTGAVLEDALRQLCRKHSVSVPDRSTIDPMNQALRKADVYSEPQAAQVRAWAAIRNSADHARFDAYDLSAVRQMHQTVAGFIAMYLGG